jgi:glycosyltransferase involved in cell wall biosynthesis
VSTRAPTFSIVSTYPPSACGIATFSAALTGGLVGLGVEVCGIRCGRFDDPRGLLVAADLYSAGEINGRAVSLLNQSDVVVLEHEYGVYPGPDGVGVVVALEAITQPLIVVCHTVLARPTPHQREILGTIAARASALVVMTEVGRARLVSEYHVSPLKVTVISHGATTIESQPLSGGGEPLLLTWGLLGPGKGIEWMLEALALLGQEMELPHYLVAGATHPVVLAQRGEEYRSMLIGRSESLGISDYVHFDGSYRSLPDLLALVSSAKIVVLPYDSVDQVTSGVLVDAVALGRPVVATNFPHAVELLSSGAGVVVGRGDPVALAQAVGGLLRDPQKLARMSAEGLRLAPELSWGRVGEQYVRLATTLTGGR